jgi:hypothetical protein
VTIAVWLQFVWLTLPNVVDMLHLVKGVMVFGGIAEALGSAEGFDGGGRGTDHWAVIVPFMSGWTSQMKVYVPAASAGTW